MFQSRNRDAFDFKRTRACACQQRHLFQSRNRDAFDFKTFNAPVPSHATMKFQSRNRDAFDFKSTPSDVLPYVP